MKKQLCALLSCILSSLTLSAADAPQKEVPPFLYKIVSADAVESITRLPKAHSFWYPYDNGNPFHASLIGLCFVGAATREDAFAASHISHDPQQTTVLTESQYENHVTTRSVEERKKLRVIQIKTELLNGTCDEQPLESDPTQSFFHYRDNDAPGTLPTRALVSAFKATHDTIPQKVRQLRDGRPAKNAAQLATVAWAGVNYSPQDWLRMREIAEAMKNIPIPPPHN